MGFDKQSGAVLNSSISLREHWWSYIFRKPTSGIMPVTELNIRKNRVSWFFHFTDKVFFANFFSPWCKVLFHITHLFKTISHGILKVGAICNMAINEEIRQPFIIQLKPSLHFRSVGFHKVAIQIQVLCRSASAHFCGSVLVDPVIWTETFVPVSIKYRDKKYGNMVEKRKVFLINDNIP